MQQRHRVYNIRCIHVNKKIEMLHLTISTWQLASPWVRGPEDLGLRTECFLPSVLP